MTNPRSEQATERFSLVVGGPLHKVLRRLRLTGPDQLPTRGAALYLALLAWLPPALLAIAQSVVNPRYAGWEYFTDPTVYSRYLVATWMMVATERYAGGRVALLAGHFREAWRIPEHGRQEFATAVAKADRRSSSALSESLMLVVALVWSSPSMNYTVTVTGSS